MFPDSEIAQKLSCKRTKATNLVTGCNALSPYYDDKVTKLCLSQMFCLLVDESNDKGDDKCVIILVRIFDRELSEIVTKFLDIPICNIGTGESLFNCIDKMFT